MEYKKKNATIFIRMPCLGMVYPGIKWRARVESYECVITSTNLYFKNHVEHEFKKWPEQVNKQNQYICLRMYILCEYMCIQCEVFRGNVPCI